MSTKRKINTTTRAAPVSYDEEAGTLDLVYASATPVSRWGYVEVLDVSEEAIDATRLDAGAVNLLMQHDAWSGLPIGNIVSHRIEDGVAVATVRLSVADEHRGIIANVAAGIYRTFSVGYEVLETEEDTRDDGVTVIKVTRWRPVEISLVSVPADPASQSRSSESSEKPAAGTIASRTFTIPQSQKKGSPMSVRNMKKPTRRRTAAEEATAAVEEETGAELTDEQAAAVEAAVETAIEDAVAEVEAGDTTTEDEAERADEEDPEADPADPEADAENPESEDEDEATRAASILRLCTRHGLSTSFALRHVQKKTPVSRVRAAVLDAIAARSPRPMSNATARRTDDLALTRRHAESAVYGIMSRRRPEAAEVGSFRDLSLVDIARRALGSEATGLKDREVVERVMRRSGAHSSSDFSFTSALGGALDRRVREIFGNLEMPLRPLIRDTSVNDFRPVSTYSIGGFPELKETVEGGEYEAGTIASESGEFGIAKFGRILTVTFEAIVNDDLRLLDTAIRGAAAKGVLLRNKVVRKAFSAKLADGKALFHASRGNLIADALSVDGLSKARTALRKVSDIDGEPMGLTPKFLVVSEELETEAQRLVSPITAAVTGEVNPFASQLTLIVDPVFQNGEWMLAADPDYGDAIELADLRGHEGVRIEEIPNHLIDGLSYRARTFAGAHPTGHRGFIKSTGTA